MSMNDPLSNVLSHINNCEKIGRKECVIKPTSKIISNTLKILKDEKYISDFKKIEDGKGGFIKIKLIGKINKCNIIKPRLAFKSNELEKFEKRFLPAKDFGIIIVSTNKGLITHNQAKKNKMGGRLIAYIY